MSIVPLKKVTLFALHRDKSRVLEELREFACLHLIEPAAARERRQSLPDRPEAAFESLRYLRDCPRKRHQARDDRDFDLAEMTRRVLRNRSAIRELSDQRDFLQQRIKVLAPWGNFVLPAEFRLRGWKLWFYQVPVGQAHHLPQGEWALQVIHQEHGQLYVVIVSKSEPPAQIMPVPRTHTGSTSLAALRAELNRVCLALEDLEAERESLTRWIRLIRGALAAEEDRLSFEKALATTQDDPPLFVLKAWVPAFAQSQLVDYAGRRKAALYFEDPSSEDNPPSLLHNPPALEAGQTLVSFYQTPHYQSWDPSLPVLSAFILFFAMILSDAGYGFVLGVLTLLFWSSLGRSPTGANFRRLAVFLAAASVAWGVLAGSYFGWMPPADSLPGRLKHINLDDFDSMMRLTLLVGAIHLGGANLWQAWMLRRHHYALAPLGWAMAMAGGYGWWLSREVSALAWLEPTAMALMAAGGSLVLLFSGRSAIRRPGDIPLRILQGLLNILGNLSKAFGDILSYLRLFALALAGSSLAETFNSLGATAYRSLAGAGLFAAILILLVGHTLNFLLGLLGGVVHGLRLNFIEFYSWALIEEGYPFQAFRRKGIQR